MTALLNVTALDAFYGDFQALFGIDLELHPGEAVAVIGANGSGKSTLLKSLAGLVKNRPGAIRLAGQNIGDHAAAKIVRMGLALVPEGRQLFPSLSVEENLLIGAYGGDRHCGANRFNLLAIVPRTIFAMHAPQHRVAAGLHGHVCMLGDAW